MNLEEIQKIRLAIETPEHQKEHDNYCFEAEEILNTYELALSKGQALPINSVSQQRELLNSFAEAWNVSMIKKEYILDSDIDRFIEIKTI